MVKYSRGGMSYGVPFINPTERTGTRKTHGYGVKNVNRINFRGGADEEGLEPTTFSRPRGRPPAVKEEMQDIPIEEQAEESIIEQKKRGRKPRAYTFQTNITDALNQAMQDLRAEELKIKKYEYDPEIRKLQLKQLKKVEKELSKIYLNCI